MEKVIKTNMDLSIVIPLYNHEKYIEECLTSILVGFDENDEIIVIDDGSTDNSVAVVERMIKEHGNIRLIENGVNKGCAFSIATGINEAKGKYIGVSNSDDYVDPGYYAKMLKVAKSTKADIVCASIAMVFGKQIYRTDILKENVVPDIPKKYFSKVSPFKISGDILLGHASASSASTKIILKKWYLKYPFIGTKANDLPSIYPILAEAENIVFCPNLYMYYRQVDNSLSKRDDFASYASVADSIVDTLKLLDEVKDEKYKEILLANNFLDFLCYVVPEIKDEKTRVGVIEHSIKTLLSYDKNVFQKMNKSKYTELFKDKNGVEYTKVLFQLLCNLDIDAVDLLIRLEGQNRRFSDRIIVLENHIENLAAENEGYKNSMSWKITAPLRSIKRTIKR